MAQRISYGALAISVLLVIIAGDAAVAQRWPEFGPVLGSLVRRGSLIPLAVAGLMLAGAIEFLRLMRAVGLRPHGRWAVLMVLTLNLSPWLLAGFGSVGTQVSVEGVTLHLAWLVLAVVGIALLQAFRGACPGAIRDVGATLLVVTYCGFLPSFMVLLRCDEGLPLEQGAWWILLFVAVTKVSDIGAYFTGTAIGRHKLVPRLSPGKTVEGFCGGVAASVLVGWLFWRMAQAGVSGPEEMLSPETYRPATDSIRATFRSLNVTQITVFSAVMSVVGQLGDLLESAFKRAASEKDSATLIPSFGGVLDLVDSPVLAAPVAWFLLTYCWGVV
jgi:phosphatidate cytidylyltransferase